jgi:hypothetical protein
MMNLRTALQTTNSHEYTPIAASWREDGSHLLGESDQEAQHEISSCSLVSIRGSTAVFGMDGLSPHLVRDSGWLRPGGKLIVGLYSTVDYSSSIIHHPSFIGFQEVKNAFGEMERDLEGGIAPRAFAGGGAVGLSGSGASGRGMFGRQETLRRALKDRRHHRGRPF